LAGGSWTPTEELLNASPMHAELFGNALALSGDTLLASAEGWGCNGPPGTCTGAAFVFRKVGGAWGQEAMLTANDGLAKDHFGTGVDVDGDVAVVGAPDADTLAADGGAAYVFRRSGTSWTQEAKLLPCDPHPGASFGRSVAVSSDTVVVGAAHDPDGPGGGAAYVFRREN